MELKIIENSKISSAQFAMSKQELLTLKGGQRSSSEEEPALSCGVLFTDCFALDGSCEFFNGTCHDFSGNCHSFS